MGFAWKKVSDALIESASGIDKVEVDFFGFSKEVPRDQMAKAAAGSGKIVSRTGDSMRIVSKEKHMGRVKAVINECEEYYGITPIAVIPNVLWDRICDHWGIFRFRNMNKSGEVSIDPNRTIPSLIMAAIVTIFSLLVVGAVEYAGVEIILTTSNPTVSPIWMFSVPLAFAIGAFYYGWQWGKVKKSPSLAIIAFVAAAGTLLGMAVDYSPANDHLVSYVALSTFVFGFGFAWLGSKCEGAIYHNYISKLLPRQFYLKTLWKDMTDGNGSKAKVKISFAVPPTEEFIDKTTKIFSYKDKGGNRLQGKPMFACVSGAIVFDPNDAANAHKQIQDEENEARRREAIRRRDPILFTEHIGGMVAIHAQIGNFAEEEEVLRFVAREGASILSVI